MELHWSGYTLVLNSLIWNSLDAKRLNKVPVGSARMGFSLTIGHIDFFNLKEYCLNLWGHNITPAPVKITDKPDDLEESQRVRAVAYQHILGLLIVV